MAIQAPRLLASEPRIEDMPGVELAEAPRVSPAGRPVRPVAVRPADAARAVAPDRQPRLADGSRADTTPYDRIAALSAVAPRDPLASHGPRAAPVTAPDIVSGWADVARDYLALYWRQLGLVSAMAITAGFLFWRLGERSRHVEQELFLGGEVRIDRPAVAGEIVFEPEPEAFDPPAASPRMAPHMTNAAQEADVLLAGGPAVRPARQHGTLREALSAMKAEMAQAQAAVEA